MGFYNETFQLCPHVVYNFVLRPSPAAVSPLSYLLGAHQACVWTLSSFLPLIFLGRASVLPFLPKELSKHLSRWPLASIVLVSLNICVTKEKHSKPTFCRIFARLHLCPFLWFLWSDLWPEPWSLFFFFFKWQNLFLRSNFYDFSNATQVKVHTQKYKHIQTFPRFVSVL